MDMTKHISNLEKQERTKKEYEEFLLVGVIKPLSFMKPKDGWDSIPDGEWRRLCQKAYTKNYNAANKEKAAKTNKEYRELKKDVLREKRKEYVSENRKYISEWMRDYSIRKKDHIRSKKREYEREKMKSDHLYSFSKKVRNNIRCALKRSNFKKNCFTIEILGCTYDEFKKYIESKFTDGMNWSNQGGKEGWQLDHIIPLATTKDLKTDEEKMTRIKELCHYTNFQPLWPKDNRTKWDRTDYNEQQQNSD